MSQKRGPRNNLESTRCIEGHVRPSLGFMYSAGPGCVRGVNGPQFESLMMIMQMAVLRARLRTRSNNDPHNHRVHDAVLPSIGGPSCCWGFTASLARHAPHPDITPVVSPGHSLREIRANTALGICWLGNRVVPQSLHVNVASASSCCLVAYCGTKPGVEEAREGTAQVTGSAPVTGST